MGRHCINPHKGANNYILKIPNYKELLRETTCETMKYSPDYYNCGGFALGTFNWYKPYRYGSGLYDEINDIREELCNENIDYYEGCSLIGERYVQYMCNQKGIRRVYNSSQLKQNEYLVAFKASDYDFHYARRLTNGRWFHKMGGDLIEELTERQVFDDDWWYSLCCNYSGDLFLLAVEYDRVV